MSNPRSLPVARRLRDAVEPIAANVYFAPEAQTAYAELGLSYGPGYFCSRGACLGQVPGEVITSAFAVFNPEVVIPAVNEGWAHTDAASILAARQRGAVASLTRLLVDNGPADAAHMARATELLQRGVAAATVEGRPLFAGLRSLGWPGDPVGDLWRAADLLREHRGDCHTVAWVGAGVDAVAITLLTSAWWGIPVGSYIRTRGWTPEQIEASIAALTDRKLLDGDRLTADGLELRLAIEEATDRGVVSVMDALGGDAELLCKLLQPWAAAIVAAKGYPVDPGSLRVPRQ